MPIYLPFVSVLIPAKNEARNITYCLNSVNNQTYPKEKFEVIVIDNCSDDNTGEIANNLGAIVYICTLSRIGAIRNFAIENSHGEYLAFLDGDCIANTNWLENGILALLDNSDIGAVGGDALARDDGTWIEKLWFFSKPRKNNIMSSLIGASMLFSRRIIVDSGGFKEDINAGEDSCLAKQIKACGFRINWQPTADVIHLGYPRTVKEFFKRQFWLASSYLSSNTGVADKMFWFTVLSMISAIMLITALVLGYQHLSWIFISIFFIGPLLFSLKRIHGTNIPIFSKQAIVIFFMSGIYFSARVLGLIYSVSGKKHERIKL